MRLVWKEQPAFDPDGETYQPKAFRDYEMGANVAGVQLNWRRPDVIELTNKDLHLLAIKVHQDPIIAGRYIDMLSHTLAIKS